MGLHTQNGGTTDPAISHIYPFDNLCHSIHDHSQNPRLGYFHLATCRTNLHFRQAGCFRMNMPPVTSRRRFLYPAYTTAPDQTPRTGKLHLPAIINAGMPRILLRRNMYISRKRHGKTVRHINHTNALHTGTDKINRHPVYNATSRKHNIHIVGKTAAPQASISLRRPYFSCRHFSGGY